MVLAKNNDIKRRMVSKKRLLSTMLLGVLFLIIPMTFLFFDPILFFAEYQFRLDNGSILHDILTKEFVGPKVDLYLFNVSNAAAFISGKDKKIKLQDVGPFVYQEYRTHDDLEINKEPGIMRYMPKLRVELILEESVAHPKDVYLILPNVPLLSAVTMMSKNPYFVRQMFNIYVNSLQSKAFIKINAHDYFWGYPDPIIKMANTIAPGLIYFNSTGLLERMYDHYADYRLEVGTSNSDKFCIKKVSRFQVNKNTPDVPDEIVNYTDTFEGAVYPPDISPEMPIHIFRQGLCKTFQFQYKERRKMDYGGDSFVYNVHNSTFNDHQLCDTTGWCPSGLKNMAPCYFDIPYTLSKGHFLDSDPQLRTRIEGLTPNREQHDIETVVDPKIGVTIAGSISLQLNLFLADVGYNSKTRKLKDMVLPLSHLKLRPPPLLPETKYALSIMYSQGPYMLLAANIFCVTLGLALLVYSAKLIYWNWVVESTKVLDKSLVQNFTKSHNLPLLLKK